MPKHRFDAGGHHFEIAASVWSGAECVSIDGRVMSSKRSFCFVTPHVFQLVEQGRRVTYEVDVLTGAGWGAQGYIVRRDGIAIAHKP
jgi:hypothetical protein